MKNQNENLTDKLKTVFGWLDVDVPAQNLGSSSIMQMSNVNTTLYDNGNVAKNGWNIQQQIAAKNAGKKTSTAASAVSDLFKGPEQLKVRIHIIFTSCF